MARARAAWLGGLAAAAAACLLGPPGCASVLPAAQAPVWIDQIPVDDEYLYAVEGYVGALYPEDNQAHAMTRAREALGRSLRSRVRGVSVVQETHVDSHWESTIMVDSDQLLEQSELIAHWTDHDGLIGKRGTVWVLMRLRKQ